jgi:fibronectin type 3 domain-containing protein
LLASCGKKTPPTIKSYEKPETPVLLKAIHREDKVILSWSYGKKENLKGFYVLKTDNGSFQQVAFIDKNQNSYADTSIKTDISYKYKIIAQSIRDVLSNDSNVVSVKPERLPPAPVNISFRIGNDNLLITWKDIGNEVFYNIYRQRENRCKTSL